ncbi:hypothetical protein ACPW96_20480 [Micromonospora sp. DT81.3]|uniref:hypothetical protein n=1 Tax=Micromonospora sp. DT81.3 TaxID=3416523 RepID=UPI003CF23069
MQREVEKRGQRAYLLPSDEISNTRLTSLLSGDAHFCIGDERVVVDEISTIWWRRPSLAQTVLQERHGDVQDDYINSNSKVTLRSTLVNHFNGRWISAPDATERASDKLFQLRCASQCGLRVPDTLISCDPVAVQRFYDFHDRNVIVKAPHNTGRRFLATREFHVEDVTNEQLAVVPSMYQERIPGTRHLRVNCFGTNIRTASIDTEELDWRPNINVPVTPYTLGPDVQKQLLLLLETLGLAMGIMDLKITPDGELVWFEVNPQGQFLFLEPLTHQGLLDLFTTFLLSE